MHRTLLGDRIIRNSLILSHSVINARPKLRSKETFVELNNNNFSCLYARESLQTCEKRIVFYIVICVSIDKNCKFQNCDRWPSWITNFETWEYGFVPCVDNMIHIKFDAYRTNRFDVIQFLVNFSFSSAAILDIEK